VNFDFRTFFAILVQFHQCSTHSFCANSLAPVKYKPKTSAQKSCVSKLMYLKAACRTLVKLTPSQHGGNNVSEQRKSPLSLSPKPNSIKSFTRERDFQTHSESSSKQLEFTGTSLNEFCFRQ
jgi:hypothetical protein